MFSSYPYAYSYTTYSMPLYSYFLPILALIVIIAGGLALYFLFVRKPNHYQGAAAKLHDALTFRTFYTEKLLRALYCITVVAILVRSIVPQCAGDQPQDGPAARGARRAAGTPAGHGSSVPAAGRAAGCRSAAAAAEPYRSAEQCSPAGSYPAASGTPAAAAAINSFKSRPKRRKSNTATPDCAASPVTRFCGAGMSSI